MSTNSFIINRLLIPISDDQQQPIDAPSAPPPATSAATSTATPTTEEKK